MFCTACGNKMRDGDRFCGSCGHGEQQTAPPREEQARRPLMRAMREKKIAGVCAGIARHYDWDVTLVRVAFLFGIVLKGIGLLAYIIGWIAMPRDDEQTVVVR
jgi:phage shock protein C